MRLRTDILGLPGLLVSGPSEIPVSSGPHLFARLAYLGGGGISLLSFKPF